LFLGENGISTPSGDKKKNDRSNDDDDDDDDINNNNNNNNIKTQSINQSIRINEL